MQDFPGLRRKRLSRKLRIIRNLSLTVRHRPNWNLNCTCYLGRVLTFRSYQSVNLSLENTVRGRGVLMNTSKLLRFALVCVAFLLPGAAFAQTSNGTVAGTVTDQSGAVVPKVDVKAES